jgi:hypothetical protein
MNGFQAALAAVIAADQRLLDLHDAGTDEQTYRHAYDAKSRAIADLDAVLSGAVVEVVQLAEAA